MRGASQDTPAGPPSHFPLAADLHHNHMQVVFKGTVRQGREEMGECKLKC